MEKEEKAVVPDQKKVASSMKATTHNLTNGRGKCPIHFYTESTDEGEETKVDVDGIDDSNAVETYKKHMRALTATKDNALANELVQRAAYAMPKSLVHESNLNVVLQTLSDQEPKDSIEAKLCLQSTALYAQGMQYLCRAENETRIPQSEYFMRNAVKLLRLHNETIEAINRYRRKGEQKVIIQHVNVEGGGQAVVGGSVVAGGGGK